MSAPHIAVCTDFSEASSRVFPLAASIARATSARLSLVHLAERPGVPAFASLGVGPPDLPMDLEKHYESLGERLRDLLWADSTFDGVDAAARLLQAGDLDALIDFVNTENVSLLVLATHGYTGAKRFLFGSFASKVIHCSPCPLLIVREASLKGGEAIHTGVPRKIVLATDLSPHGEPAFSLACSWSRLFDAKLLVHYVIEKPIGLAAYPKFMLEGWWEHEQHLREETEEKLTRRLAEEAEGLDARFTITSGTPATEIVRELEDFGADLVVLGTHGRSGFQDLMLGSVAQKVIGGSPCPALLVRPPRDK